MGNSLTSDRGGRPRYNVKQLLTIGVIFHFIFIGTVFDCYFTSPVVTGMAAHGLGHAEAKRLVLIVGDGLRADLLFNLNPFPGITDAPEVSAPYIRSIAETRGAFGISHTRVPTESRPGHVAIIAGMYEDVSAVTKGWKENPVDFDSVFNQSSHTFAFGSPDILPMFARGAVPGRVKTWTYHEDEEDFTKDATALDQWVLNEFRTLLENATTDATLQSELQSEKIVFFFHLLGLDTTGHAYRPHSSEYMRNIQVVDNIVQQLESLFSEHYPDGGTSFIFTADHGMSAIGNHGDGDPDNTRTPLIAWGRGIRGPLPDSSPSSHDSYSLPWGLNHLLRRDVEQADIAALMASVLGINWPVNSVGVLPDVDPARPGYLAPAAGEETIARAAAVNAQVILEHYTTKHFLKKQKTPFYRTFEPLEKLDLHTHESYRTSSLCAIDELIKVGDWYKAREMSAELVTLGLKGLHYLHTYERTLIRSIVTVAYIGWSLYTTLFIFRPDQIVVPPSKVSFAIDAVILFLLTISWAFFAFQEAPWTYYLYTAFPSYFWRAVLLRGVPFLVNFREQTKGKFLHVGMISGMAVIAALQGMVLAYTYRFIWSIGFILIGIVWPLSWPKERRTSYPFAAPTWVTSCLVSSIFPLLSVEKKESLPSILAGGSLILLCGWITASYDFELADRIRLRKKRLQPLFVVQALLIVAMMMVTSSSVRSLQSKKGLPLANQVLAWVILVSASLIPFACGQMCLTPSSKLLLYFFGLSPCFIILSISVEGLFYVSYVANLTAWIITESIVRKGSLHLKTEQEKIYKFKFDDLRIALFFLFFVQVGFFGIGNVASISSFYLEPVYRLVPVFSPFCMAALLIFKIIAPYIILSIVTALLNHSLHLPPFSLLLVALSLTDGMTITFFYRVRDMGSWLEIGQSITFFCITSLLLLWSTTICAVGEHLLSDIVTTKTSKAQ